MPPQQLAREGRRRQSTALLGGKGEGKDGIVPSCARSWKAVRDGGAGAPGGKGPELVKSWGNGPLRCGLPRRMCLQLSAPQHTSAQHPQAVSDSELAS